MTATPKPATPTITSCRGLKYRDTGTTERMIAEHDAVCAWYDAEIARLSKPRTVVPEYKGVTYHKEDECPWRFSREGIRSYNYESVVSLIYAHVLYFTDDDHAPLLALRDAKPRTLRDEAKAALSRAFRSGEIMAQERHSEAGWWIGTDAEADALALFASEAS